MEEISKKIFKWYKFNHRELPWRQTQNAYYIWLSETILQQTRVLQGLPYYEKFMAAYPTVAHLANAQEQEVLRLWQGLGYYSRARNLLKCAKIVHKELGGRFPTTEKSLQKLPGIGPYTAAAIASIAFNEAAPVLDGNVYRVLSRLYCIKEPINRPAGRKIFLSAAQQLIHQHPQPGNHNQAMMELGATVCTPARPNCEDCPVSSHCCAFEGGQQQQFPVKLPKKKGRNRYFHYFLIKDGIGLYLTKRKGNDIWKNLYELPMMETQAAIQPTPEEIEKKFTNKIISIAQIASAKHILTHQNITACFYEVEFKAAPELSDVIFVPFNKLDEYPLPRLIEKFFEDYL